ncbi:hypothetical protein QBC43DRAFT_349596 [Cladorrhinum sp. PSN259]|nr:hypothetical protein QBC43DRAFT_349596 [Cladorrhinum sp. PSN259]
MTTPFSGLSRQGVPFIYFTNFVSPTSPASTLTLKAGDLWIRASDLVATVGSDRFIGLRINGGTITVQNSTVSTHNPYFEVANAVVGAVLSINNDTDTPVTIPSGTVISRPQSATFLFKVGSTQLTVAGTATQQLLGFNAVLSYSQTAATVKGTNQINFPLKNDASTYTITSGVNGSFKLSGTAPCTGSAWIFNASLPISNGALIAVHESGFLQLAFGKGFQFSLNAVSMAGSSSTMSQCFIISADEAWEVLGSMPMPAYKLPLPAKGILTTIASKTDVSFTLAKSQAQEIVLLPSSFHVTLDEPRSVNNERLGITVPGGSVRVGWNATDGTTTVNAGGTMPEVRKLAWSFAIKNYFTACEPPTSVTVSSKYPPASSTTPQDFYGTVTGSATVVMPIFYSFPTLPDPYTTNALGFQRSDSTSQLLTVTVDWPAADQSHIDFSLPADVLRKVQWTRPSSATGDYGPVQKDDQSLLTRMNITYFTESEAALTLLDLSSANGQFGVDFATTSGVGTQVQDLMLQVPTSAVRSMALSPITWEPAVTLPAPPDFPEIYQFPYDGPATRLSTTAVTMVPVAPLEILDTIQENYNHANQEFRARFNLPFGMIAYARVAKSKLPLVPSTILRYNMPTFSTAGIAGVPQVSIIPQSRRILIPGGDPRFSPAIAGNAVMLKFSESGQNQPMPILGNSAHDVNLDFGPAGKMQLVPLTRIDLSGYGESTSSDWFNLDAPAPATQRVDFDTYVGRCERTLIQQVYEIVHIGAKCIRTVTMKRQNNGLIYRTNVLGAGSSGTYAFQNAAIVTHPGIFPKYSNIRNIRDAGTPPIMIQTTRLSSIFYDADLTVSISGSPSVTTSALNHQGFIIIDETDQTKLFGPSQYAELLQNHGSQIGGPLNCTVKLAHLTLKLSSISVNSSTRTTSGANPEFVVAANHTVEFAGSGEWSFLQVPQSANAIAIRSAGVPLIRQGAASSGAAPTTPYRWADAKDLYGDSPANDYALLHSGREQRVLFPRPKIETTGPAQISSNVVPLIADPYALAWSSGPFPGTSLCIPFETLSNPASLPSFRLNIDTNGFISLSIPSNPFLAPVTERTLFKTADVAAVAYSPNSMVTLSINSSDPQPYEFRLSNVALSMQTSDAGTLSELNRVTGDLTCLPNHQSQFDNSQYKLGDTFGPMASTAEWLSNLGIIPPVLVSMTNDWACWGSLDLDLDKLLFYLSKSAGPGGDAAAGFFEQFIPELDYKLSFKMSFTKAITTSTTYRAVVRIPKVLAGADALLTGYVTIFSLTPLLPGTAGNTTGYESRDPSTSTTIEFGFGFGAGYSVTVFQQTAYAYGLVSGIGVINKTTNSSGWGIGILLKLHVALMGGALGVDVITEAKCLDLSVNCKRNNVPQKTTQWMVGQFTLEIDIHVLWVLNIDFAIQLQGSKNTNGGPCDLNRKDIPLDLLGASSPHEREDALKVLSSYALCYKTACRIRAQSSPAGTSCPTGVASKAGEAGPMGSKCYYRAAQGVARPWSW